MLTLASLAHLVFHYGRTRTKWSPFGIARPKCCLAAGITRQQSTCGVLVASLQRWQCEDLSSLVTRRSTRSSASSGECRAGCSANTSTPADHVPVTRTLGTPTEENWPGIKLLPDYKSSFPQWKGMPLSKAVPTLDESGIDLLKSMLVYDPAGRISGKFRPSSLFVGKASDPILRFAAKRSLNHPYLADITS